MVGFGIHSNPLSITNVRRQELAAEEAARNLAEDEAKRLAEEHARKEEAEARRQHDEEEAAAEAAAEGTVARSLHLAAAAD